MKRAKNLYDRIATQENLREAFRKAAISKRSKKGCIDFEADFQTNIQKLRSQLINETPDIGRYRFFTVRDPKNRKVCEASFPEQVLHHAIMNVCEPVLDSYAIYDSYACRKGKGNRRALQRAGEFARKNGWYLKLDIRKYFDSIDHDVMMALLERRFKDERLLRLFAKILDTYHTTPGKGIPIGNLISQHLANFYLGVLDHWIKNVRRIKAYIRYMDDFVLFAGSAPELQIELNEIRIFLKKGLDLRLKNDIQLNNCYLGLPFLGFRVFPNHIRLSPRSLRRYSEKLREYETYYKEGFWPEKELSRHVMSLNAFTDGGDALQIRRLVIERFGMVYE